MIYPFEPFKIDQRFKDKSFYGPHEGLDLNGPSGGNTDCGTLLKAVCDGEVVLTSEGDKNYGNLLVLYVKGSFGERWVRYAHCERFLVEVGKVKQGQVIATMGRSGNSTTCHLHLDVLKKKPFNWRRYIQNVDDLFEDPLIFLEYKSKEEELVITDQTLIPQIVDPFSGKPMEVQAIRGKIADYEREITHLRRKLDELSNIKPSVASSDQPEGMSNPLPTMVPAKPSFLDQIKRWFTKFIG